MPCAVSQLHFSVESPGEAVVAGEAPHAGARPDPRTRRCAGGVLGSKAAASRKGTRLRNVPEHLMAICSCGPRRGQALPVHPPPSAKRLVEGDEVNAQAALALGQVVLGLED